MEPGSPRKEGLGDDDERALLEEALSSDGESLHEALAQEREVAELAPQERGDMLESFHTQTVGAVFVWTAETLLFALVHYCVFLGADALVGGGALLARWASANMVLGAAAVAGANALFAFVEREPGVFSRHYMMCTQAYCGMVSCVGTVFSAVAWKATHAASWRDTFVQSESALVPAALLAVAVVNNVQWLLSLVLTYSCTPFGQSNSAFLHVPVAAALVLFLVLVNEAATNQLVVCPGTYRTAAVYLATNGAILSSLALHVLSAVEFDPAGLFPAWMHSGLHTRARLDAYALLHGLGLSFATLCYGAAARLSATTFWATVAVLAFTALVTLVQGADVRFALGTLLTSDDRDERRARALEAELARGFAEARRRAAIPVGRPVGLPVARGRHARGDEREDEAVHARLREEAEHFHRRSRPAPRKTVLELLQHVPVAVRRTTQ
jgi:hypothetical protein